MTYQEAFPSPSDEFEDEAAHVARQCDALLVKSGERISKLNEALERETETHNAVLALREEALSLQGVAPRMWSMRALARQHGIAPGQTEPPVTLRVVPNPSESDRDPPQPPPVTPEPPTVSERSAPAAKTPEPFQPAEIIIRSKKQQEVLAVIASRPDLPWGTEDLAKILGTPQEPKARKSLRNCLRLLLECGALERVRREGDRHTYYRSRQNWKFI
ncbi:hypothetical protein [Streptomyces sp. CoH27]|uniref:hypothetical protein n=1 Tax=Streptomyces sp. CoH27 TaxID=2875763 RepID=UPI001CD7BD68|nr:hypothetical protein [Streptomyces sp. CoH27]